MALSVLRRLIEETTVRNSPRRLRANQDAQGSDAKMCSLRACNTRVTCARRNALRASQLLTLAIDGYSGHMAIVWS